MTKYDSKNKSSQSTTLHKEREGEATWVGSCCPAAAAAHDGVNLILSYLPSLTTCNIFKNLMH